MGTGELTRKTVEEGALLASELNIGDEVEILITDGADSEVRARQDPRSPHWRSAVVDKLPDEDGFFWVRIGVEPRAMKYHCSIRNDVGYFYLWRYLMGKMADEKWRATR